MNISLYPMLEFVKIYRKISTLI